MTSSPSFSQADSELTLDQIYSSALEMRQKIQSIRVDYCRAAKQTEVATRHSIKEFETRIEQRSFSLAYPKRRMLVKSIEESEIPSDGQFSIDADHCVYHDSGRLSKAEADENEQFVVQVEPYSIYCNFRFSDSVRAHPPQDIWLFPWVLKGTGGPYFVHPKQELMNGVICHVIEWINWDKIWIDSQRPGVMVRRERSFEFEECENGKCVSETIDFLKLEDLGNGITLPKKIIASNFGALQDCPKLRDCIVTIDELEVSRIKVNG